MNAGAPDEIDTPVHQDDPKMLRQAIFGHKSPYRLVYGVASLPTGVPVELDDIFGT